jgi:hypothetical protein
MAVEHHAERVDVGGGGEGIVANVLGTGVAESNAAHARLGHVGAGGHGLTGYHDVTGLDVAMQDEVGMDAVDGSAKL